MTLWSARAVLRVLVDTPDGEECDAEAYELLLQDLAPAQGLRTLLEGDGVAAAAQRLEEKGYRVSAEMLREACNMIVGNTPRTPTGRLEVHVLTPACPLQ